MLQLLPHEEGRNQLLLNRYQITPVIDASSLIICLHQLLAHCFCSQELLDLPLQKMLRETGPSSSKGRNSGLCQAGGSAVLQTDLFRRITNVYLMKREHFKTYYTGNHTVFTVSEWPMQSVPVSVISKC